VGATDSQGNTIFNKGGTAIGSGACADSTSIAIGAHANAGACKATITPACTIANGYCENLTNSELKAVALTFAANLRKWGKEESAAYNEADDQAAFNRDRYSFFMQSYKRDAAKLWALFAEKYDPPPPCPNVPAFTEARQFAEGASNINDLHREEHLAAWLECYAHALRPQ
jgi:hypothetical protein